MEASTSSTLPSFPHSTSGKMGTASVTDHYPKTYRYFELFYFLFSETFFAVVEKNITLKASLKVAHVKYDFQITHEIILHSICTYIYILWKRIIYEKIIFFSPSFNFDSRALIASPAGCTHSLKEISIRTMREFIKRRSYFEKRVSIVQDFRLRFLFLLYMGDLLPKIRLLYTCNAFKENNTLFSPRNYVYFASFFYTQFGTFATFFYSNNVL